MTDVADIEIKLGSFFLPGAVICEFASVEDLNNKAVIGYGLEIKEKYTSDMNVISIVVTKCGILRLTGNKNIWIESQSKVYVPLIGDRIIGKVIKKAGDYYQLEFGSTSFAYLNYLNFHDATKNKRPDVKIGDVVYCQVVRTGRGVDPEVWCVNSARKSAGMGVVDRSEHSIIRLDLPTVSKLKNIAVFPLLQKLGLKLLPHEIILGDNGWVWLAARSSREFVAMAKCLELAPYMDESQIKELTRAVRSGLSYADQ